ncbi:hypothetical protein ARMGADRAFT_120401 [Armillaria gallica]|uniref:DUF6534 domain-containing protein n=1 Tax=Armillaria gallica TaxID=47427 RepID=A0A2H3CMD0_ARMGA|nr:hypothetical protein ARMGADRAFT_120401 [Armillaria gallica]
MRMSSMIVNTSNSNRLFKKLSISGDQPIAMTYYLSGQRSEQMLWLSALPRMIIREARLSTIRQEQEMLLYSFTYKDASVCKRYKLTRFSCLSPILDFSPAMSSQIASTVPSLGMTLGAVYIGATVAAIFFGISNLQMVIYYKNYPDDSWIYRYSVAIIWILDALHVALSTHAVYHYLIDLFGNYLGLYHIVWSFKLQLLICMVMIIWVEALYAVRLWKLGGHFNRTLSWIVVLTVAIALGSGIFSVYDAYSISNFLLIPSIKGSICVLFAMAATSDFIIAFSMCYYLHKSREASAFSSTSDMLYGLMRLVVISGLATSTCSLLTLITYLVWQDSLIFLGVDLILPKLYVNSLLAMLNARRDHRATNKAPSVPKVLRFTYKDSSTEANTSIPPMPSITSLEHPKEGLIHNV